MKKLVTLVLVTLLCASGAIAAVLHATWQNATQNTDASAIPASGPGSITSSVMEYGPCNATKTALASIAGTITIPGAIQLADSPDLPPGDWCAHVANVNTYGSQGLWSDVGFKTVPKPIPGKPSNFTFG